MPRLRLDPLPDRLTPAVTFRFDYSQDTSGLFTNPAARAALERAAAGLGSQLGDALAAISPGGGNSWVALATNPATGDRLRVNNLAVGANELVVYVAGADLPGSTLGETIPGAAAARGSAAWADTVQGRGQPGALLADPTDFGPWGGFVAFDSLARWSFDPAGPAANRLDFESVARHELGHVLGVGTSDSFARDVTPGGFVGPNAEAVYGGPVPLDGDDHFAGGVVSGGQEAAMTPAVPRGERRRFTPLDWAALADIGWQVAPAAAVAPPPPTAPSSGGGAAVAAVGADGGGGPAVSRLDAAGRVVSTAFAFDPALTGGVRVASADFDGDGVPDVLAGTGPGAAEVRALSGATGAELFRLSPFEAGFAGGLFVAAGDLTGDGVPDVVVTADAGGGPRVRVFDGVTRRPVADFFGIDDPAFRGGARVAVGDLDGDGRADLLVAAGAGGGPRVAGFDGRSLTGTPRKLFADFFAFEPALRDGVYLAAGDLDADGAADVVIGAGPGGGPRVRVLGGRQLVRGTQATLADFFAGDPGSRGGVRVATPDLDGDGRADLLVGAGRGAGAWAAGYSRRQVLTADPAAGFEYTVFDGFGGGVFVG